MFHGLAFLLFCALIARAEDLTFSSANKRFWIKIEEESSPSQLPGTGDAMVTMLEHANNSDRVLWRRKIADYSGTTPLVSNKGTFFITSFFNDPPEIHTETGSFKSRFTEDAEAGTDGVIMGLEESASKELLRRWLQNSDQWEAINLPDGSKLEPTQQLIADWNEKTRQAILRKFGSQEKRILQQKIVSLSPKFDRAAGLLRGGEDDAEPSQADWVFLAKRKVSADRALLEKMLRGRARSFSGPGVVFNGVGVYFRDGYSFAQSDRNRLRADRMLALWDGQTLSDRRARYLLAQVAGKVHLPTPILKNAGTLRVYLIPKGKENSAWIDSEETESLDCPLPKPYADLTDLIDEVAFSFGTVLPGNYFAKAIWDKRPPLDNKSNPGAGDYESALFGPFTVEAGLSISNIFLDCSRKSSAGETYYQADELALKRWKIEGELSPGSFDPQQEIFSRRFDKWVIRTNLPASSNAPVIARISFGQISDSSIQSGKEDSPSLKVFFHLNRQLPLEKMLIKLRLIGDHGQAFDSSDPSGLSSLNTMPFAFETFRFCVFTNYPSGSETFRLIAYPGTNATTPLFNYTLTNLINTNIAIPKPLPPQLEKR